MQFLHGPTMVIGRRTDVKIANRELFLPSNVERIAKSEGKLHPKYGIDYFAIASNRFPWHEVPNLVIGRPAYDNFLVATASRYNVSVVDATSTVVALHQTDAEGIGSGHRRNDSNYNQWVIRRYAAGHSGCRNTGCTEYITKLIYPANPDLLTSSASLPSKKRGRGTVNIVVVLRQGRK